MSMRGLKDFEIVSSAIFKQQQKKALFFFSPAGKTYLLMKVLNQYFNEIFFPRN